MVPIAGSGVDIVYRLGSHLWPQRKGELSQWDSSLGTCNWGSQNLAVWWQRHMEHGWSQGCLDSRATFAPIKPGSSRVLLVDPINISSDIIKINTSFFWVSMSGFPFPPTKRAFATNTAPTLGKNMQMELCLNIQGFPVWGTASTVNYTVCKYRWFLTHPSLALLYCTNCKHFSHSPNLLCS